MHSCILAEHLNANIVLAFGICFFNSIFQLNSVVGYFLACGAFINAAASYFITIGSQSVDSKEEKKKSTLHNQISLIEFQIFVVLQMLSACNTLHFLILSQRKCECT